VGTWLARIGLASAALANSVRGLLLPRFARRRPPLRAPLRVLITGASTGIGLALARELLAHTEHKLALAARASSLHRFEELAIVVSDRVMLVPLDVEIAAERDAAVAAVCARWGGVDVLVNNAGVCFRSVAEHVTDADHHRQLEVNYLAPMALTRLVLTGMRARGHGRIINVSSVGGMMAMPTMTVYSASKFALEGASEALWYEVRPWGVMVTLIEPGFINSDGFRKVILTGASRAGEYDLWDAYHRHYVNMDELIARLARFARRTPRDVARTIAKVIAAERPPLRVAGTTDAFLFGLLRRALPQRLYFALLYALLPRIWEWGDVASRVSSRPPPAARDTPSGAAVPPSRREETRAEPPP
jgi:NAD(P)-dependent dehydrogenase (short-subunit alcohol dehydrogenase family)